MDKRYKYAFIIGVVIGALVAFTVLISGGKDENPKGPESALEKFYEAAATCSWSDAENFCDTSAMKHWIDSYRTLWNELNQTDSSALAIASSIMTEIEIDICREEKVKGGKELYYKIEIAGNSKEKKAVVRKEDGEWKITEITDVP